MSGEQMEKWLADANQRIKQLQAENKLLDAHAKEWGIKAQQAEAENERLKSHLEDIRAEAESDYHKDGKRIAELRAEIERLRTDAERYRWLKANQLNEVMWVHMEYKAKAYSYEELDAAIDAAIDAARESE
jgi:predicted RNase H-like nuclease (RuvC/YqgF family)